MKRQLIEDVKRDLRGERFANVGDLCYYVSRVHGVELTLTQGRELAEVLSTLEYFAKIGIEVKDA